jgi:hypothetical protein
MTLDFSDFFGALDEDEFEEIPVGVEEFVYSKDFLGFPKLSKYQMDIVKIGSQIYYEDTLKKLHGSREGEKLWKQNKKELILALGKGSGKDALSQIICAYVVYQLLCLKDPAAYYGKPTGDSIDIINVAINADQASNVFFKGFKTRINECPWFKGKYKALGKSVEFNKQITVYSGNSQGEATEGYNVILAVLDEIDGFDEGGREEGNPLANKMYNTLSGTVSSRFDDIGKVLLLSWPRSQEGFIMSKYNECILEKETVEYSHTFKLNEDLPDDYQGNEYSIQWTEDNITGFKYSEIWALRRPTWKVNPTKTINSFKRDFYKNAADALGRFACNPADFVDGGWFPAKEKVDAAFSAGNGLTDVTGDVEITLKPDPTKEYYVHVDLARVQDNCGWAMGHVESWQTTIFDNDGEVHPNVVIDMVRYWKPDRDRPVDFSDVRDFTIKVKKAGFNIKLVTFDRWNSDQTIKHLNDVGIKAEKLSVGRDQYTDLATLMGEHRIKGPDVLLLRTELKKLVVLPNGNVDHTNKSSKDLSDAVCGAAYNAATLTPRNGMVEVVTHADIIRERRKIAGDRAEVANNNNLIVAPKRMPQDIEDFLSGMKIL